MAVPLCGCGAVIPTWPGGVHAPSALQCGSEPFVDVLIQLLMQRAIRGDGGAMAVGMFAAWHGRKCVFQYVHSVILGYHPRQTPAQNAKEMWFLLCPFRSQMSIITSSRNRQPRDFSNALGRNAHANQHETERSLFTVNLPQRAPEAPQMEQTARQG